MDHHHLSQSLAFEEDLLIGDLTVRETLVTSLMLRKVTGWRALSIHIFHGLSHIGRNTIFFNIKTSRLGTP